MGRALSCVGEVGGWARPDGTCQNSLLIPPIETPLGLTVAFGAGAAASAVNAVAGGGSLISFPALVGLGLPDRIANATNSIALWPGSASGAWGFREHWPPVRGWFKKLIAPTVAGSVLGAVLLVVSPESVFQIAVPFLILLATGLLAFQDRIKARARRRQTSLSGIGLMALQFLVAVYGGYFGAGMGIMMLGTMALAVDASFHELNALKNWLAVVINFGAAAVLFSQGFVAIVPAIAVMLGALVGGYVSARYAQRLDPDKLRGYVVAYGLMMGFWFLYRAVTA